MKIRPRNPPLGKYSPTLCSAYLCNPLHMLWQFHPLFVSVGQEPIVERKLEEKIDKYKQDILLLHQIIAATSNCRES